MVYSGGESLHASTFFLFVTMNTSPLISVTYLQLWHDIDVDIERIEELHSPVRRVSRLEHANVVDITELFEEGLFRNRA